MKKILFFATILVTVNFAKAQTADEVVKRHIDSLGGTVALSKITSIVREATLSTNGFDVALTMTTSCGKGYRMDISVMGQTGYQIVTPTKGWNYMPFQGQSEVVSMSEDELKASQNNLECQSPFINYATLGSKLTLDGTAKVEGKECFKIKLTDAKDKVKTYFIDKQSYMIAKRIQPSKDGNDEETTYSNYKTVSGIKYAYSLTNERGEVVINNMKLNEAVDESIFSVK